MRQNLLIRSAPVFCCLFACTSALAQLSGVYVGVQGAISPSEATFAKTLDNTHPDNPTEFAGMLFQTSNTGDGNLGNIGLVGGYRMALDDGFLSFQIEASKGSGRVSGFVLGDGTSEHRAQYGEAWPETFEVGSNTELGLTIQWGRELSSSNWTAVTGYYFLVSAKRSNVDLETRYEIGCFLITSCVGPQFESGIFSYEATGMIYSFGGGLEHAFSDNFVAQLELRIETPIEDDWNQLFEDGTLSVEPNLELRSFRIAINLSRFL